jgi:hypothetical protein
MHKYDQHHAYVHVLRVVHEYAQFLIDLVRASGPSVCNCMALLLVGWMVKRTHLQP